MRFTILTIVQWFAAGPRDTELIIYCLTVMGLASDIGVRFPAQPQVEKLVVACHWSAVYNAEP